MTLPLTTTTTRHQRWSTSAPGTLDLIESASPSVVGAITGKEIYAFSGTANSGWKEDLSAKLACDLEDVEYGDLITDLGTGRMYRVLSAFLVQGLGLDHTQAILSGYATTGVYSLYRGTTDDEYGDKIPNASDALWQHVPGEVAERTRSTQDPVTEQPGSVRQLAGRFPPLMDIQVRDRIKDEDTGITYVVAAVGLVSGSTPSDVGVELTRITE